mmetsp:Transcript_6520/g.17465  ORF Transcript_6520/g.17465 Transcript_6520/m.17465 type:complete len:110 (+) Transcript_6520:478-807(+)
MCAERTVLTERRSRSMRKKREKKIKKKSALLSSLFKTLHSRSEHQQAVCGHRRASLAERYDTARSSSGPHCILNLQFAKGSARVGPMLTIPIGAERAWAARTSRNTLYT